MNQQITIRGLSNGKTQITTVENGKCKTVETNSKNISGIGNVTYNTQHSNTNIHDMFEQFPKFTPTTQSHNVVHSNESLEQSLREPGPKNINQTTTHYGPKGEPYTINVQIKDNGTNTYKKIGGTYNI